MTCNVFGGTLNLAQSIHCVSFVVTLHWSRVRAIDLCWWASIVADVYRQRHRLISPLLNPSSRKSLCHPMQVYIQPGPDMDSKG